jgi:hypothetical protein
MESLYYVVQVGAKVWTQWEWVITVVNFAWNRVIL